MSIRVIKRPFSLDCGLMSIGSVFKDGAKYHLLFDDHNTFAFKREKAEEILQALQIGLQNITDEEIAEVNKRMLLEVRPQWFYETYGGNDPMWIEYVAEHPEVNQPPPKKVRKLIAGYVYVIKGGEHCKIGCTKNVKQRLKPMGAQAPFPMETLVLIATGDMEVLEGKLHETFAAKRIRGEWFNLDDEDIDYLRRNYDITDPSRLIAK